MLHDFLEVNSDNHLSIGGFDAVKLAEEYGTPLYIMHEDTIRQNIRTYRDALEKCMGKGSMPLYASKAFSCKRIYEIVNEEGIGMDAVSSGEIYTAFKAGFPMSKLYFHGNNKTEKDIEFALDCKIGCFVVDNQDELEALENICGKRGVKQDILLRITPGIDPHTHKAIKTGNVDSKFGSAIQTKQAEEIVLKAINCKNLVYKGVHCHIGSSIFDFGPYEEAVDIMVGFLCDIKAKTGVETQVLNLGGGFGVRYIEDDPKVDYAKNIEKITEKLKKLCKEKDIKLPTLLMEPGRSIVAASGVTLYKAGSVKEITGFRNYVSIDGGMPDNPRYALYQSLYTVINASKAGNKAEYECSVAGRCCESGDLIAENVKLASPEKGDIIAVLSTGAYNFSMASNYNRIPRPPVVMISGDKKYTAVRRETFDDLIRNDL